MVESQITRDKCAQDTYRVILQFMGRPIGKTVVYNFSSLVDALSNCGLRVVLVLPPWFFISPKWWRYSKKIVSREKVLDEIKRSSGKRKAVAHYVTAAQLYGIDETWTHIVVECFDETGARRYIDSYEKYRLTDYPSSLPPNESEKRLYRRDGAIALISGE